MLPRIILADDHGMLVDAFRKLLEPICEIVGTATNGRQLIKLAMKLLPDIILLDIHMPLLNGIGAAQQLKRVLPCAKLIFITADEDPDICAHAMKCGASGYLLKVSSATELRNCIDAVIRGKSYMARKMADKLENVFQKRGPKLLAPSLTPRQREVLQLLAEGFSMKQVAAELATTYRTVAFHKYRIMNDHELPSNADLLRFAFEQGLVGNVLKPVYQ